MRRSFNVVIFAEPAMAGVATGVFASGGGAGTVQSRKSGVTRITLDAV